MNTKAVKQGFLRVTTILKYNALPLGVKHFLFIPSQIIAAPHRSFKKFKIMPN
ncbi:hypothetical protein TRIP_C60566 [Candidatus Zixiibacteriota bacterium]|nr:hypothetical protein TRIP_C60566 [candidate division Zixibacteria bacterium]